MNTSTIPTPAPKKTRSIKLTIYHRTLIIYFFNNIYMETGRSPVPYNWLEFPRANTYIQDYDLVARIFIG